jgi:hypothetical protein
MKLGSTTINKAYLGATEINKLMLGSTAVFDNTSTPPAYDTLISSDAEWSSYFAANDDTAIAGQVIALAPGNYTAKTLTDRTPASEFKIIAQNASNKPVIDELTLDGCINVTFEDIAFVSSTWDTPSGQCVLLAGDNASLKFERCTFTGNYRGTVGSINVVDDLPEYACIAADVGEHGVAHAVGNGLAGHAAAALGHIGHDGRFQQLDVVGLDGHVVDSW